MDTKNLELIQKLIPVLVTVIKGIKDITDEDVSNMTLAEVEQMLKDVQWPEFDFKSSEN